MNLSIFCSSFYASHYIPVACYLDGQRLCSCKSLESEGNVWLPAEIALPEVLRSPEVFFSPLAGLYGYVRVRETGELLILGPIFSGEVGEDAVFGFMRKCRIPANRKNETAEFLSALPKYTYNQFINLLAFLHLQLNGEHLNVIEHFQLAGNGRGAELARQHTKKEMEAKETGREHGTYRFERLMLELVRQGDVEGLGRLFRQIVDAKEMQEGTLAENPLRQAKNILIGWVTMVGKVGAIEGGMDVEEAYNLIDLYVQECEKAQSVEPVKLLQYNLVMDFAERVAQVRIPKNTSEEMYRCMQYIRNHIGERISVDDVAAHIGRSRAYTTRRFKTETGLTVNGYILQRRIREAKNMLRFTDMSIAEISEYLCFSSQSYFQRCFKDLCGMTPAAFRKVPAVK